MRVLSLGVPLPDIQVDNYGWSNALSFFDYDAIVVDPMVALSDMVEGVVRDGMSYTTYNEEAIQNGPTTALTIGLADLLKRRADETERLLAKGGLVVVFAYPDVPHPQVSGFTGAHRYHWLPAPAGKDYGPAYIKPATGTEVRVSDYEHPFADFIERHRTAVQYRAIFGEGLQGPGEDARIIARSVGGAPVAVDLAVGGGRIVFLPALPVRLASGDRTSVASTIVGGIRDLLLIAAEGPAPVWVSGVELPGLRAAKGHVDEAETKVDDAEGDLDDARAEYLAIDRYRRLLWQEGKYGLDLPVRDALAFLGMTSFAKADEPALFSYGGRYVLVESEGSPEAVGMSAHYRLRERIERHIAERKEAPTALLVVNGYRDMPPSSRKAQYDDALKVTAQTMRYCLLESGRLFDAVAAKMAGADEGIKTFLDAVLTTEGVYDGPNIEVPAPAEESTEEEPRDDE